MERPHWHASTAHLARLVSDYPGPHPTDDPVGRAAWAEQVLRWLRHDHAAAWTELMALVASLLAGTPSPPGCCRASDHPK